MKTFDEARSLAFLHESVCLKHLTESEIVETERIYKELHEAIEIHGIGGISEGILSSILGGAAGFLLGPTIGKIIANAMGIEKGILYDMLTSRLVSTALGSALAKNIGR